MKLLPYTPAFVKDAAKAISRICKSEFKSVVDDTLTELLGIPTLVVTMYALRMEGVHEVLHLWCAHSEEIAVCTHCGSISTTVHQQSGRCIRHLDVWGKMTFLHFLSRRFKCEDCGRVFTEQLSFVDSHRRQSIAFEVHIHESSLAETTKAVAIREKLSHSTVKEIFHRISALKRSAKGVGKTRVLGIDELSLKKRYKQFVLVISDITEKNILAILPDRKKETLEEWIETLSPEMKKAIKYVSIDMWRPYYKVAKSKLPKANVVVDRFHVMKQLNNRMTQLRTNYQRNSSPEIKEALKGSRWLIVRNRCDLSSKDEEHLNQILDLCPELRTMYLLKEEFRFIFEKIQCREKAARFLDAWMRKAERTGDKYLAKFLVTFKNWREQILNYFIERITNGFVEGLNNGLRTIIRMAYGYRNFNNFRVRAMAQFG